MRLEFEASHVNLEASGNAIHEFNCIITVDSQVLQKAMV